MNKKVAIVYDWLDSWGGAERVLLTFAEMFPEAHWYTSVFDENRASWAKNLNPQTSFIQKLPLVKNNRILSTPLYPFAFEAFDFNSYDLVISITSSFAKGIITRHPTRHICYLLTPTRFLWSAETEYQTSSLINPYKNYLKKWDKVAASRPDSYICISKTVQKRLQLLCGRTGVVINPPFDIEYWERIKQSMSSHPELVSGSESNNLIRRELPGSRIKYGMTNDKPKTLYSILHTSYYLVVSRLEPYKRVDLVVETFKRLNDKNLVIIGAGSQLSKLKQRASKNITFLQNLTDEELASLYSNAQALIMPQEEDFGLTCLEGQFFSCPIIAYKKGGATEIVQEGKTGLFFDRQTVDNLTSALDKFDGGAYNLKQDIEKYGKDNVAKFSKKIFMEKFLTELNRIDTNYHELH